MLTLRFIKKVQRMLRQTDDLENLEGSFTHTNPPPSSSAPTACDWCVIQGRCSIGRVYQTRIFPGPRASRPCGCICHPCNLNTDDLLHPNGRCLCYGEGRCELCKKWAAEEEEQG